MIIYPLPNHSGDQHGWLAVAAWLVMAAGVAFKGI